MPDRFVRDALLRSEKWASLTDAETQLLFIRLLLLADDFGVYDGRIGVIATQAFPLQPMGEQELDGVAAMVKDLHRADLIIRFSNAGRPFIAILQWGCDLRGSRRFPAPPIDIDLEGLNVRGKFGKPVGWNNPVGADPVSVLLGLDGREVSPQPPEWRPAEHLRPIAGAKVGWRREVVPPVTGSVEPQELITGRVRQAARVRQPEAVSVSPAAVTGGSGEGVVAVASLQTPGDGVGDGERNEAPPVTTAPTPAPLNGQIKFEDGGFVGVSEAQRLRWQDMFHELRIPDELDRAAAWLAVNDGERAAIAEANGFGSFIMRWLLKSERDR